MASRPFNPAGQVGWVYHEFFLDHRTGVHHPESPARLQAIVEALREADLEKRLTALPFVAATVEQLTRVHDPAYVDLVRMACEEGFSFIGSAETRICADSYYTATLAAGGVIAACEAVMAGRAATAFCAVRPPGHHAEADQALGFCLFNHVAIAAEHLIRRYGLARVAVVDLDVHHGNGTQHIFETRRDVFYISIHERPGTLAFPGSGEEEEIGHGEGVGYTLNVPLTAGSGEEAYHRVLQNQVMPALERYQPQFVLISAGFDALSSDPLAHLNLQPSSYGWITRQLLNMAKRYAHGRLVSVLEGGYDLAAFPKAVVEHLRALGVGE